jgi:hypothetical protein
VTVVLYNKYIELSCTNLYAQKDALLNLPPPTPPAHPHPNLFRSSTLTYAPQKTPF